MCKSEVQLKKRKSPKGSVKNWFRFFEKFLENQEIRLTFSQDSIFSKNTFLVSQVEKKVSEKFSPDFLLRLRLFLAPFFFSIIIKLNHGL